MIPFFPEPAPAPAARRRWVKRATRLRRPFKDSDPRSWNLTLAASGTRVPVRLAAESPALLAAAVADLEWRLAVAELLSTRPCWWQRSARAAWNAEWDRWERERCRIAESAALAVAAL